eukprot:PITA_01623
MNDEYQFIMKNGFWEIVPRPEDKSMVTIKWLYKIKHVADGSIDKFKARFVARGFSQDEGIDYEETFAPTTRYTTIQSLISLATSMGWKQALRAWYAIMDAYLQRFGFRKSTVDPNLCIKLENDEPVIILLYVDDLLITGVEERIQECKKLLAAEFDMKDLGLMHYYLGLEVWQEPNEIYLGQGKYVIELLKKFDMMECKPMTTPLITNLKMLKNSESSPADPTKYRQLIGSLMYLVNTRPDICFAVNFLSQFQLEPRHDHWIAAKHILRYLQGTIHYCLKYEKGKGVHLEGFTDSDWGGSEKDGRSTTGGCFSLGSSMVSSMSRNQETIALSSAEAEYIAACEVSREAVWLRKMLSDLFAGPLDSTIIRCDNTSCIRLSKDPIFHGKMKHINSKYHYIRKLVQDGVLKLEYIL